MNVSEFRHCFNPEGIGVGDTVRLRDGRLIVVENMGGRHASKVWGKGMIGELNATSVGLVMKSQSDERQ